MWRDSKEVKKSGEAVPPVTKSCSASKRVSEAVMISLFCRMFWSTFKHHKTERNCKWRQAAGAAHQGETNSLWRHTVTYIREVSAHTHTHTRACVCSGVCWICRLNQPPWVLIPLEDVAGRCFFFPATGKKKKPDRMFSEPTTWWSGREDASQRFVRSHPPLFCAICAPVL